MTLAPALQATGESDAADAAPRRGSTYYHLYDQLGSTRLLTDASQTVTDTYHYYAFGEIRSSSGSTTNPFKFVGRLGYYDDPSTDFQYLRARYYAPAHGRFTAPDTVGGLLGVTPLAAPYYAYGDNSPLLWVDPSGWRDNRRCWMWCRGVCGLAGSVGCGWACAAIVPFPLSLLICPIVCGPAVGAGCNALCRRICGPQPPGYWLPPPSRGAPPILLPSPDPVPPSQRTWCDCVRNYQPKGTGDSGGCERECCTNLGQPGNSKWDCMKECERRFSPPGGPSYP